MHFLTHLAPSFSAERRKGAKIVAKETGMSERLVKGWLYCCFYRLSLTHTLHFSGGPIVDENGVLVGIVSFGEGCGLPG